MTRCDKCDKPMMEVIYTGPQTAPVPVCADHLQVVASQYRELTANGQK